MRITNGYRWWWHKLTAMDKIYNKITLTFDIALLVKQVQLRSHYTGSHISNQAGATQESTLSITDAELDLLYLNLRDAANDLYQKLQSITRKPESPFQYDHLNTATQKRNIIYELWLDENWDMSLSASLNLACEKVLVNYCLKDWYSTTGQQLPYQVALLNYTQAERELRSVINSRKTPVRRPYNFI